MNAEQLTAVTMPASLVLCVLIITVGVLVIKKGKK